VVARGSPVRDDSPEAPLQRHLPPLAGPADCAGQVPAPALHGLPPTQEPSGPAPQPRSQTAPQRKHSSKTAGDKQKSKAPAVKR
jgi:hypothetical protein